MPKYCPTCLAEYRDHIDICPVDHSLLTQKRPENFLRLIDFYAASNIVEAELIIALLLDNNIQATESVTGISQLPVADQTRYVIAVAKKDFAEARRVVEQARVDMVISSAGVYL